MELESLKEFYIQNLPSYQGFTRSLENLLVTLCQQDKIKFHLIEGRTKSADSLIDKIALKYEEYDTERPLERVTDICGLRIIVYHLGEIEKVRNLIESNFLIDADNSENKSTKLKSNEFGYLSDHYVVKLSSNRGGLIEWRQYSDFKAEIQVRTVLQHAWASISHDIEYKSKIEIPDLLKRKLNRLAGLFELADEQFQEIRNERAGIKDAIVAGMQVEGRDVYNEINLDTLKHFFSFEIEILDIYRRMATEAGFRRQDGFISEEAKMKFLQEDIEEIMILLDILNINSIEEFKAELILATATAPNYLRRVFLSNRLNIEGPNSWQVSDSFIIILVLLYRIDSKTLMVYQPTRWTPRILNGIKGVIVNLKNIE